MKLVRKNRNLLGFGFAVMSFMLSGCSSTPGSTKADSSYKMASGEVAPIAASYSERAVAVDLVDIRGSNCPTDSSWTDRDWKKLIPLANVCVKANNWSKVEEIGNALAKSAHLTPWGAYYLALAAEGRGDFPRAIWMLELALKKGPGEGIFHYELGRVYWELKETAAALKHLKIASDISPSLTEAHWVMGQIALDRKDLSEAKSRLQKALATNSSYFPTLLALAQLSVVNSDWKAAEHYLLRAVSVNPRSTKARVGLASVQENNLKKHGEALSVYQNIKRLSSEHKLDEMPVINVDERIASLQMLINQSNESSRVTSRQPSTEGKVSK